MEKNRISRANKEKLHFALQRYESAKLEIKRQREEEIRLENERRERERRERELRTQQSIEAFKRGFMSLAKIVLPIAVCYGLYVYSKSLNARNVQNFVENTLIFVSLTAFFANVYLSNDDRGFTQGNDFFLKIKIFNALAKLLFYISVPLIFISPFVILFIGFGIVCGLIKDGFARAIGEPAFWYLVGIVLAGIDFILWGKLCLDEYYNKTKFKTKFNIDGGGGGGANADWISLVSTAILILYSYSPLYFSITD